MTSFENIFATESLLAALEVLIKLGLTAVLAGAIGWERERAGRPAGIRTHMLVAIGVTLICEVSKNFADGGDPSRIAAQIVTGIGFLGAGAIMRTGFEVRGLTTAASIWAASGIAMATSVGGYFYIVAIVATALALATLTMVEAIERKASAGGKAAHRIHVRLTAASELGAVLGVLEGAGCSVTELSIRGTDAMLTVSGNSPGEVIAAIAEMPEVIEVVLGT